VLIIDQSFLSDIPVIAEITILAVTPPSRAFERLAVIASSALASSKRYYYVLKLQIERICGGTSFSKVLLKSIMDRRFSLRIEGKLVLNLRNRRS